MTTRAALYCRMSRLPNGDKATTVQTQEADLRSEAKRRKLDVVGLYVDDGISAFDRKKVRPSWRELLASVERGEIDVILTVRADRLARQTLDLEVLLAAAEANDVTIIEDGNVVEPGGDDADLLRIKGMFAARESRVKSKRVTRAKDERAKQGRYAGGPRPFGYEHDGVTIREEEAALVRELYERVIGGDGLPTIARDWQDRGIRNGNGNSYRPGDLRQTLKRPRYAGLREHQGEVVGDAEWDGVVSQEEWSRAQAAIKARGANQPRSGRERRSRVLSGLIRCVECGKRMRVHQYHDGRRPPRYICAEFDCHAVSVRCDMAEQEVEARVLARLTDPKTVKRIEKAAANVPDYSKLIADVETLEEDLQGLAADFGDGRITRTEWMSARGGVEDRLRLARKKLTETEASSGVLIDPAGAVDSWNAFEMEQKRSVISRLVDSIRVKEGDRVKFDPKRLQVLWRV